VHVDELLRLLHEFTREISRTHCTLQYSTVQYCTVQYSTVLYSTVLYCTSTQRILLYCTTVHSYYCRTVQYWVLASHCEGFLIVPLRLLERGHVKKGHFSKNKILCNRFGDRAKKKFITVVLTMKVKVEVLILITRPLVIFQKFPSQVLY
jgi:hypothetical protein